jgi:hypothetical protein
MNSETLTSSKLILIAGFLLWKVAGLVAVGGDI